MRSHHPEFETKGADVIGLYRDAPRHAGVFCIDEKPAIEATRHRFVLAQSSRTVVFQNRARCDRCADEAHDVLFGQLSEGALRFPGILADARCRFGGAHDIPWACHPPIPPGGR